jgi:hypothetical protein
LKICDRNEQKVGNDFVMYSTNEDVEKIEFCDLPFRTELDAPWNAGMTDDIGFEYLRKYPSCEVIGFNEKCRR